MNDTDLLQHIVTALAFRFKKAIAPSGEDFGMFKAGKQTRSPCEIINHMTDLANKASLKITAGHFNSPPSAIQDFLSESTRFLEALQRLSETIQATTIDKEIAMRLLQGPLLDIATHIGQIALLNGLNGNPVSKENYFSADLD